MSDHCRLCANPLRGSRRKWLFGGSGSLSAIYNHVMGSPISRTPPRRSPRSHGSKGSPEDSEFLCGKCCHSLNVYHRYDLVMSRMRQLCERRSTRLLAEREKLSFTLRSIHARAWGLPLPDYQEHSQNRNRHGYYGLTSELCSTDHPLHRRPLSPGYQLLCPGSPFPGQQNSYHGSLGSLTSGTPTKLYHQLLEQDRSTWEHESWWEDRSDTCSRCAKGDKCRYCSSWRVSDSNYETVCTVPRRRKHSRDEMDLSSLHRSKSLGSFCGESSRETLLSFSTSSLDGLSFTGEDEMGGVWEPQSPLFNSPPVFPSSKPVLREALKGLKEITYSPVKTPAQSRIPVRKRGSYEKMIAETRSIRNKDEETLEQSLGEETEEDMDAFMGIEPEVCRSQVSRAQRIQDTIKWLQSQLQANNHQDHKESFKEQKELIQELLKALNVKEEILEDCLTLLLSLPVESDPSYGNVVTLIEKLREQEKKLKTEQEELKENVHQNKEETICLKTELREREEDLARLSRVLRGNQDTITDLRDVLSEKEFSIQQMKISLESAVRSAASQDALRLAALREKDTLISAVQGALCSSNQDVEALADSLLSQGLEDLDGMLPGVSPTEALLTQLMEKSSLVSQSLTDSQKQSIQHQKDIQDLLNDLNESQTLLQDQLQHCKQRLQAGAQEKNTLREALRLCEAELRAERQRYMCDMQLAHEEMAKLQGTARERDRTTQKLLQEAQNRDHTIKRLQERLSQGGVMRDML
ncbi:myosin-J heavy chain [Xenopus laevis]|uniref:Myosin-J heavy chain n=1 Tax=Xenopus laevis TaxID=8355 RepID=A0A8J1LPX0_XENLA|nr:myosin-J heavy chain [Xenopus laevis]